MRTEMVHRSPRDLFSSARAYKAADYFSPTTSVVKAYYQGADPRLRLPRAMRKRVEEYEDWIQRHGEEGTTGIINIGLCVYVYI